MHQIVQYITAGFLDQPAFKHVPHLPLHHFVAVLWLQLGDGLDRILLAVADARGLQALQQTLRLVWGRCEG